jgi:chemosensory pili system protein ChpA (sensor histidine kinase/response regulator)
MPNTEKQVVLLVDDNEATRTLVIALLQRDFRVEVATDGTEAIEKLRTNHYASVLLDLRMPQPDGFAVLEFLKTNAPERLRTVLVVTAMLTRNELERAKSFGVR